MQQVNRKRLEFSHYLPSGPYTVELVAIIHQPIKEGVPCMGGVELVLKIVAGHCLGQYFSVCDFEGDYAWLVHSRSTIFRITLAHTKCPQCEYGYSVSFSDFRALERGKMLSVV